METDRQPILLIGTNSSLLEGVADLLQVAGYHVETTSTWAETEYALYITPPRLVIVDLSSTAADAYRLAEQIRHNPLWAQVPILFVSFSGDEPIRSLQHLVARQGGGSVHFYAHTLLSMDGLLAQVRACMPA